MRISRKNTFVIFRRRSIDRRGLMNNSSPSVRTLHMVIRCTWCLSIHRHNMLIIDHLFLHRERYVDVNKSREWARHVLLSLHLSSRTYSARLYTRLESNTFVHRFDWDDPPSHQHEICTRSPSTPIADRRCPDTRAEPFLDACVQTIGRPSCPCPCENLFQSRRNHSTVG